MSYCSNCLWRKWNLSLLNFSSSKKCKCFVKFRFQFKSCQKYSWTRPSQYMPHLQTEEQGYWYHLILLQPFPTTTHTYNKKYLSWFGIEIQALQADAQRKISFEGKTDNREWLKIIFKFWFSAVYLWSPVFALFDIQIVVQYSACISDNTWKYFKHLIYLTLSCKLWLGQDYYPILVVNIDS